MEYKIQQNSEQNRFEAIFEGRVIGLVDYEYSPSRNSLIIPHTEVSEEFGGQGIAAALNKEVLEFARKNGYRVIPVCSYTRTYVERHPQYQDLID